jgi:ketosteroid isomerase-like protein
MSNLQTVQNIYAAFGRGDVPAILEAMAPDVEWEYGGGSHEVPWLEPRRGREGAGAFFRVVADMLDIRAFAVTNIIEGSGGVVLALIDIEAIVKPSGKRFSEIDEVHIWRFDAQGRVAKFRHRADTHMQTLAYRGQ